MDAAEGIFIAGGLGLGLVLLMRARATAPTGPGTMTNNLAPPSPGGQPEGFDPLKDPFTSSIINTLPGGKQAYGVLKPVYDDLLHPLQRALNKTITPAINAAPGFHDPTTAVITTKNSDGTITRTVASPNAYTKYVGEPISHAGTAVVHFFGDLF